MRSLILVWVLILCLGSWCDAYRVTSSSSASSYSSSGAAGASASASGGNYYLSPWAYSHMDAVRQLADNLRQAYNAQSRGGYSGQYNTQTWSDSFANSIGKSTDELNAFSRQLSEKILSDLQSGQVSYGIVSQPNYFESQAANALEKLSKDAEFIDGQQHQVELYEPTVPQIASTDLSKFDEVRHVNYPTEVKVVNGQTYITNKNCTTATLHGGSPNNPMLTTVRVNRTTTHTTVPVYINQGSAILQPFLNSQHHNIYNHLNRTEVGVTGYSPEVTVDDSVIVGMNQMNQMHNSYTPPIVIPVEGGGDTQPDYFGIGSQFGVRPGHTVTIRKYNRTIITGPDGKPIVSGSESESVWDNGKLVYKYVAPFGNVSWTKDDLWKREERERLFWLFQTGSIGIQELQNWQVNQEDRILALAYRFNKTKEEIEEWQRQELDRYRALLNQYNTVSSDLTEWQKNERGRIDWLIHQNGITFQDLERWQKENQQKLNVLARQYRISIDDLKSFQRKELDRLYTIFNTQNSQITSDNKIVFEHQERDRLNNILLQHNATVDQLQDQIRNDQERYKQLAVQYKLNVEDMEKFFKNELKRLSDVITKQQEEMKRITSWQQSERSRLEDVIRHHNLTVEQLEMKMKYDRTYLQELAQKYHVSLEELEKWQRAELDRLHETGKVNLQKELEVWQQQERDRMLNIIKQNHLTIEEYEAKIGSDRARLQQLASIYQVQVEEIEKWLREEAQRLKNEGVFSDVQKNLTLWQQQERDRLQLIVQNNELTIEELQKKIKDDQARLYGLAHTYQVQVEDIEDWLKKELLRLQSEGLIKMEDLQGWQKTEREKLERLVHDNKLTVDEFEKKLLNDKNRLQQLATQYHVELKDIENWLRQESGRLQSLGLIQEEKLSEWQKIERDRLLALIAKNDLSIGELEKKIKNDQVHLYSLARQYSVRVEEIEEWLRKEVLRLQKQADLEAANLKGWQKLTRERLLQLVRSNDLTIDEFVRRINNDRSYLQQLANQYHVEVEEIEEWVRSEGNRLESLGLIKPNAPLTEWQEVERDHVLKIVMGQDQITVDQLEERLKNDRTHLYGVAQSYKVQVQEIEEWIKKELQRLQNLGVVQIEQLKAWQQSERDRLATLVAQQQDGFSVDEIEKKLKADRERLQQLAWQNNVQVKEIEEWIHKELERMKNQGQVQIEKLTEWQKNERDRLLILAQQQSDLTAAELETKLQADRSRLQQLARQYHVEVEEVEEWIRKEVQRLRDQGKLHIENLTAWQVNERDRLQQLIQQQSQLSVEDVEKQLKADRNRLQQLAWQYHIQVEEVEEWIRKEAQRLRNQGQLHIENLTDWQLKERQRLQQLIQQNSDVTIEEFENKIKFDQGRLQNLAYQYHVNVEEIEAWIKKEIQRLRDEGKLQIEKLTAWQQAEKDRLIQLAQQQSQLTLTELEQKLTNDRRRLEALANQYHISVQEIEEWIKKEAERLENQGVIGNLQNWQKLERSRIQDLIKQHNTTFDDFRSQVKLDHNRLQQLAQQYHTTVEEVESWIINEGNRQFKPEALTVWQVHEQQRLQNLVQAQDLSLEDLVKQVKSDRGRLQQLAQQYHVTVEEIEEWIISESQKLIKPVQLTDWQRTERDRLIQLILKQNLSIEELKKQILADRQRLQQLAWQYNTNVEEIQNWIIQEGEKFIAPAPLTQWQQNEHDRLVKLIQDQNLSIEELNKQVLADRQRLQQLAWQYHVTVEEIQEWIIKEGQKLIKPVQLTVWQQDEHDRLVRLIQDQNLSIDELKRQILADRQRLQQLSRQYHVTVEEIQEWIIKEGQKLIKPVQLTVWQQDEHDRLVRLIQDQNLSIDELKRQILADRQRLQQLSRQYHVTVEEIQEWIIKEAQKLAVPAPLTEWQASELDRLKQLIREQNISVDQLRQQLKVDRTRLQQLAYQYHVTVEEIEEWILNQGQKLIKPTSANNPLLWQQHEREYLQALAQTNLLTLKNFEKHLSQDELRMENVANHYQISVDEIVDFWRKEVQRLAALKQITEGEDVTVDVNQWQNGEEQYILRLIQEYDYSIEELERKLRDDRAHLQRLADQYHVTIEQIEEWYITELQKLLQQKKIYSENLTDWQKREKERIYLTLNQQQITIEELERQLTRDRNALRRLAQQYHITIEQLINWQQKEIQRLNNLGYGKRPLYQNNWQITEKKRLRAIPEKVIITKEELREFFAGDTYFQGNLTEKYNVSLEELKLFQGQELQDMKTEGVLESITLKHLEDWQRRERDRLYNLIRTQNFDLKKLRSWQTPDRLSMITRIYRIPVDTLRNWQYQEMQRIEDIAKHYKINLNRLEEFRYGELERLQVAAHQSTLAQIELLNWTSREEARLKALRARTGLSGAQLDKWRRKLFLLAQGLIDLDFNEAGYGGIELNTNTSASGKRNETVSKDRGDQPPQVYEESFEESEPSLGGSYDPSAPLVQAPESPKWPPGRGYGHPPHAHGPPPHAHGRYSNYQAERIHSKKEYTFNVPAEVPSTDTNYQNRYSHGRGGSYANMQSGSLTQSDQEDGQQQVQVEDWNPYAEIAGQKSEKIEDLGQQHVQQEILPEVHVADSHSSQTSADVTAQAIAEGPVVQAESVTEEPKSVWGKFKNSAKSWFG